MKPKQESKQERKHVFLYRKKDNKICQIYLQWIASDRVWEVLVENGPKGEPLTRTFFHRLFKEHYSLSEQIYRHQVRRKRSAGFVNEKLHIDLGEYEE